MAHVLIVDDERAITDMLRLIFQMEHWTVEVANNVLDAQRLLAAEVFDLVVTDMRMETDAAGALVARAAKQVKHPPAVVILTAFPMSSAQWSACGADAFVLKGNTGIKELIRTAKKAIGDRAA
jgi:DNA-binding NtrC family response regulator